MSMNTTQTETRWSRPRSAIPAIVILCLFSGGVGYGIGEARAVNRADAQAQAQPEIAANNYRHMMELVEAKKEVKELREKLAANQQASR